ncbi:MAG: 2-hydroxyacyl-CoA dehydratase family protein [Gemmatimonadales bacterium]|nr:2-hydroxyacyl-CoA dehydratase [Gemmatimonadota bacterium]MCC7134661.1 2-hydroxyacyl-CoA dehydratase [Gemmatimonadales bacterium]MDX2060128.1 2-hydroxyacyl-CoA dehydratase family protein [Gemmatimonadales bacterium]
MTQLASAAALKSVMANYFSALGQAARDRSAPVAWCTSVGPAELLRALGFQVFFPENHAAMLGASRRANHVMPRAHALGYSQDICSYLTSDIGAFRAGETPLATYGLTEVPKADVLVFNTNQCRDVRDWFEWYGRRWGVPVVGVRSPRYVDEVREADVDGVTVQLEALVAPLEQVAGRRLDPTALSEAVRLSRRLSDLWGACLDTATHRPAPLTFFDGTVHMGPAVVLRGAPEACDYYEVLLEELESRAGARHAAIPGEAFRVFWDGMPIWGRLRALGSLFEEFHTAVVASTYCNSWVFAALDPAEPFRSMARASLELFIVRSEEPKERYLERMARFYQVDGLIFHDCRTCPNNSNTRYGMPQRLGDRLGLPTLVLDGDVNDLRCFSDEQARTNVEGFVELLADRGATARGSR